MTPLDDASDELTSVLVEVSDRFAEARLGVTAEVLLPTPADGGRSVYLCFTKHDREWLLGIRTISDVGFDDEEFKPIAAAPRFHRVLAANALPKLLKELQDKASTMLQDVTTATNQARLFLRGLKEHGL